ncbi:flavin-nucleotide-binding protein [Fervidicella metallireducens AeB]|uniref:Flavin-nucleotide-binding protein n=1 Tax=Fervidicella metallireducens AeB TaxID=1403537 RepID=A0A017RVP2_9CLOT|nr:flavin-nucleotide-binding protein [Fervidicella metallireducens AeB]
MEEFLNCHSTCTLSTASNKRVRGTPIEYNYKNNYIYLLTEGGEKFCNLLKNCSVSVSVYDNFQGMGKLAGMQIQGEAFLIDEKSREYKDVLNLRGINYENIIKLPITMNIIKIKLLKAEFIYSKFKSLGYDSKQIYYFTR